MAPRILIASASVGAGHVRAAEAIEVALKETLPNAYIRHLDVLTLTSRLFRRFYAKSYIHMVNRAPHLFGYFYDLLDTKVSSEQPGDMVRVWLEKGNLTRFQRLLQEERWDLVINTHFLPAEIIALLRLKGKIAIPQVTVTTDFETHRLWINQPCDRYFTATDEATTVLQFWGVPAGDIIQTGIPIHPLFSTPHDRAALLAKHQLAMDRPIILQLAGGLGVGPIAQLYHALLQVETPAQFVAVAGKNEKLKADLEGVVCPERHRTKVYGFTREMDELMAVADLVVTKPGGLTTSETLARGAVMVIVNPIPGQETRNSDWLLENGAAIKVNHPSVLATKVTRLLADPERLQRLKANVKRLARPRAAYDVLEHSLKLIGKVPVVAVK